MGVVNKTIALLIILGFLVVTYLAFKWVGVFFVSALVIIPLLWIIAIGTNEQLKRYARFIKKHPEFREEIKKS